MESIENMWKKFSLSDKEGLNVDLVNTVQQPENILAAKFLTSRLLNMDAVARTFKPLWKTRQSFTVQDLGGNKVAFVFEDAMDLERVLVNELWTYDKFLVVFQRVQGDGPIQDSLFSHTSFWVQLHNIPLRRRTEAAAETIGRSIGLVQTVASSDDERGGENCMRVRVRLAVNRPLCRGRLVNLEEGKKSWIAFRYERLQNFCYWCGCLDHGEKDCDIGLQQHQSSAKDEYQYGAWLRASSDRPPRKTVVTVPGNQPNGRDKSKHPEQPNHHDATETNDLSCDRSEKGKNPENTVYDLENDMEIEENPSFPFQAPGKKSDNDIFNDQLREIDQAINYKPNEEHVSEQVSDLINSSISTTNQVQEAVGATAKNMSPLPNPSRRPLADISNGPITTPNHRSTSTKWKKLARAHKPIRESSPKVQPQKRELLFTEADTAHGKRLRAVPDQSLPETMICISWNCRGLGNQGTVQELAKLVRIKDPSVLFLSETWMDEDRLEGLRNTDQPWRLTCFYGAPETHLRDQSWNLLRNLHGQFSLPWCCVGDFNEIVRSSEKCGRRDQSERQMQRFRAVIDDCGFLDLGFRGFPFTWCNNRRGTATTWLRLDRFMATNDWILRFSSAVVDHLESTTSDHKPICLSTQPVRMTRPRKKLFRFEDMWRSDPSCEPTITKAWVTKTRGSPMVQATGKIQNCGAALTGWSRKQFGHITKLLREKTEQLRRAEMDSIHGCGHDTVISIRKEVSDLLLKEERMWKQRSRESWLKEGDHNTKFFHNRASHRKRRNTISALRMANGEVVTDENLIGAQFIEYYQALFTAQPLEDTEVVLDSIQPCVTQEMNQSLTCPFTEEEVLIAMKQMGPLKAPGPDGMPPIFYQSYWHVVGKDITAAVLYCLQSGTLLPALNHTFVTLIPKTKSPETVTEYRPISLCNVLYKLISKVLANRLKKILPHIISETQSAFVPGRLITDNILIAFETLHHMHNKRTGKVGSMALKLDMSKAYDRVEWGFVKQEILAIYEKASGQQLNRAKTNLFFSRNTTQATQEDIKEILGVPSIQQYEKYLGLPSLVGKEKITCFSQIKERVWSKVKGWKEKLLSQAGREILIKAVVQAIPTYTMNCFKLPVTLCKEIEGIIRRFWWGQTSDRRKIHWIRWEKLCNSKGEGEKTRGSFAWRSILKAKGLILSGLSWRVGDGAQIPIKGSNWLLEEGHRRILSPLTNLPVDAKVGELIHGSPPTWNTHKIHSLFLPYDVEAILKIPLSGRQQEDRLYWFETQNGKYSVRSGYKLLCKDDRANIPESSRQWDPDPLWKRIWRARVPAKIRTFLWRACHDSLPTKLGLFKRQVTPNPLCETCRAQSEDSLHALWKCPAVSRVWSLDPDFSDLQNLAPMSLSALMRQIIQSNSDHLFEKFAITSWLLWHKRNQDRLRLPSDPHSQILPRAHALLSEYLAVTTENKPQKPLPPQVRWKPPSSNLFKVNFDGAIFRESNTGGLGVVIRDKTGMVIATLSQKVTGNHTAEMIEALAARRAIRFAMEVGVTNAEFEGDAETVIRDLYRTAPIYTPYGLVIEDAKVLLAEIQNFSLSHTRRSGNSVAHALARRASKCHSYLVWMEEVPPDINHVLLNDLSALAVE
uniref:Uncharacterized protein n=1 Tax=Fagus sylvatica TaxID=28930 RepID=A0A2N9G219_FAGSY